MICTNIFFLQILFTNLFDNFFWWISLDESVWCIFLTNCFEIFFDEFGPFFWTNFWEDCFNWTIVFFGWMFFFLDEWFFGEMFLFFWINVYLYMNVFWRIFVWQFFGQFLRSLWRFCSIILFDLQSFNRWTWKKQGAKNRVILIQKEKRQPGLFFFWLTKTLFFCTLLFSGPYFAPDFFQGHKPTHVF